eukprot:TRINITY_DN2722_c0_g1_i1.p1 TRINITY_DN2722_c0_g1~~TRINITY_DN2722_c0_g1_i1.p1  ORF type:complete len:431 (+),score=197.74 TRINITY_DN2722_c0_g1_i1:137-1429(+)
MQTRSKTGTMNKPFERYQMDHSYSPSKEVSSSSSHKKRKKKEKILFHSEKKSKTKKSIQKNTRRFSLDSHSTHSNGKEEIDKEESNESTKQEEDEEEEEEDESSKYERIRMENIKRNRELLSSLGLFNSESSKPFSLEEVVEKPKKVKLVKKLSAPIQRRSSSRKSNGKELQENFDPSFVRPIPTRDSNGNLFFPDLTGELAEFKPNLTPSQVLRAGSFGGAFFGRSDTVKEDWKEFPKEWFEGLDMEHQILSNYNNLEVNKYKVKLSFSSRYFPYDPRGWFQWYCRFYCGRRTPDDKRQIQWWIEKQGGRKKSLIGSIYQAGGVDWIEDYSISPMQRQHLLHLAYHLSEADYVDITKSRKKGRPRKYKVKGSKHSLNSSMDSIKTPSKNGESQSEANDSFYDEGESFDNSFLSEEEEEPEDEKDEDWKK